ncbi:HD-GYP domain-containing protein [Clostridium oryzae]|uniref:Cyclic di-GMP phosphodiesterase response regulator RpfG n=1 Tax=Clostridium oryzae TaxID=1450648 RepID=A0A1V4IGF9_9CLOT|nr:HD-GYP domain-containing protein [Clostridium oryzae]OPJ58999.1 cyclic di-GMP phosphodiesterase response regulator RpfG [Clostridium oryzae]
MRLELINRVVDGEILGKSILTSEGKVLLRAGIKLTNQYINKLKEIGVIYIYVEDDRLNDICVEDTRMLEMKKHAIKNMANIVKSINNCDSKLFKKNIRQVEELINYIIDDGNVSTSVYDIKTFDNYTYLHCIDTSIMATFMGLSFKFKEADIKDLGMGAILHDIGKTKVGNVIVNKPGPLTPEEFEEMKRHPSYGVDMLKEYYSISQNILDIVQQHHERVDGKGYPNKISGNKINKLANIVSICDVYDAVNNDRSYRKKFKPNEAYELILSGSGSAFESDNVLKFKETFAVYPLGSCLKLSNDIEGYVIKQNSNYPDRPVLRVLYDSETKKPIPFYEVDLLKNPDITVEAII